MGKAWEMSYLPMGEIFSSSYVTAGERQAEGEALSEVQGRVKS